MYHTVFIIRVSKLKVYLTLTPQIELLQRSREKKADSQWPSSQT